MKFFKIVSKIVFTVFVAYVIIQSVIMIWLGFMIPEVGKTLLITIISLILGFILGCLRAIDKIKVTGIKE